MGQIKDILRTMDYGPAPESDTDVRNWLETHATGFGHFINGKTKSRRRVQKVVIGAMNSSHAMEYFKPGTLIIYVRPGIEAPQPPPDPAPAEPVPGAPQA